MKHSLFRSRFLLLGGFSIALVSILGATLPWWSSFLGFEPYLIPSESMNPTLERGDYIIVETFSTARFGSIRRGDVIVFAYSPEDARAHQGNCEIRDDPHILVKRVVGLPHDIIKLENGGVEVNGLAFTHFEEESPFGGVWEKTPSGKRYRVRFDRDEMREEQLFRIPEGRVFVLGDNRIDSSDSRCWGPVRFGDVKGRATRVFYSEDDRGSIRWARLGTKL